MTEILALLAIAAVTTGPPAMLAAVAPDAWREAVFDPSGWLLGGNAYLAGHLRGAVLDLFLILAIALLLSEAMAWVARRGIPDELHPNGAVWSRALADRPAGTYPWVGVMLQDGTLIEGVLKTIDLSTSGDERDLAIAGPIRVTAPGGTSGQPNPILDRVVVPAREIRWITAMHLPEKLGS